MEKELIVEKEIGIDMGHRVPNHKSACRNLHGHRYKIVVGVSGFLIDKKGDSSEGMVIDFKDLKTVLMNEIHDKFDHGFVMYDGDKFVDKFRELKETEGQNIHFVPFIPTAENLAKYWFELMEQILKNEYKIELKYIKVWETPTSVAIYEK
jgi:6-pyruvoyltetrahydropterin/6-carboxytetrahydropterin synthase